MEINLNDMFVIDVKTGDRVGEVSAININNTSFKIESFVYSDGVFAERKEVVVEDILSMSDQIIVIK